LDNKLFDITDAGYNHEVYFYKFIILLYIFVELSHLTYFCSHEQNTKHTYVQIKYLNHKSGYRYRPFC